ncbi:hypothetical protein [Endozoicomonas sp. 8E]|uniref:hypothetical protein n=1 Tax=Endozoicomonas sp. 8E TaxID=3035692 RepID=UPI002938DAE2|nr:hypothetical protein [Endozoicomonas sp. 8E]WOG30067.1 hypothetical protein P6910_10550 [Endozoicomonas sp. 8E]
MSQNPLQRGNELTPVIPGFILVIPAKAGIHTTHHQNHTARCPLGLVIPEKAEIHRWRWIPAFAGMTTSEHGNELTPVIPGFILVIPAKAGIHTTHHQNHTARCPLGLVIPEKAEIHRWRWIPAFAGMTTSEHGNELTLVIPDFILVIPDFILVIPAKAGIYTDSPPEPHCPVPPGPVIPKKAEAHCWHWIPAFAGMTT